MLVLDGDASLEDGNVLQPVEEKQVADLLEVDLTSGPLLEAGERLDAAKAERDVERIRELRAEAACRAARGP